MAYQNQEVNAIFAKCQERMEHSLLALKNEFINLRAGRANAHILDKVTVDYYGTPTPIHQMANISVPEARVLVVAVWDVSCLKEVEKAIINANLGLMPTNDGKVLRIHFPELTEDRRKDLVKQVKKMAEDSKIGLRNERRNAMESLKKLNKDKKITDDEYAIFEKDVDKLITKHTDVVDKTSKEKEKEVMSV